MTVESETTRVSYTGSGITGPFTIPFYFLEDDDIRAIVVTIADGTEDELTLTTDFTLTGSGDENGGTLTLVVAISSSYRLVIFRDPDLLQETDYPANDAFPSETHEMVADKAMMIAQRDRELILRSIRQPDGDSADIDTLPSVTERASKYMGFDADGDPVAVDGSADATPISSFMATVVDDTSAPAARLTLGFPDIAAKGDLMVGSADDTLTKLAAGTDGYPLSAESGTTSGLIYLPPKRDGNIINGEIVESHAGNAVTYTLKGWGGVDLSATNPCYLIFPSATLTSPGLSIVKVTANIAVTLRSGDTIGHVSAIAQHSFVYAINNAGAAELAVSNLPPDYPGTFHGQRLISTTAISGGALTSATAIYSTTSRSNVSWLPIAKVRGTQTTAGTWAASPTQVDMAPFTIPSCAFSGYMAGNQSVNHNSFTTLNIDTEDFDTDATFASNIHTPNVAGIYHYIAHSQLLNVTADNQIVIGIDKNNAGSPTHSYSEARESVATAAISLAAPAQILMNGTSDTVRVKVFQANSGTGAKNFAGGAGFTRFAGRRG